MRSLLIAATVLLAACGTRAGLTLPPKPMSATAAPATATLADNSSKPQTETAR